MPTPGALKLVVASAALVGAAVAAWHPHAAQVPERAVPTASPGSKQPAASYLPDRFPQAERDAPIEPLPPQF